MRSLSPVALVARFLVHLDVVDKFSLLIGVIALP
jgi:hypothetical protein